MSTTITIPERINYHPADVAPVEVDFVKNLGSGETISSAEVYLQSQQSTEDPAPAPGISSVSVSGSAVTFKLVDPGVDVYDLLIVATTSAASKLSAVLRVNVSRT